MIQDTGQLLASSVGHWQSPDITTTMAFLGALAIGIMYIRRHRNTRTFGIQKDKKFRCKKFGMLVKVCHVGTCEFYNKCRSI